MSTRSVKVIVGHGSRDPVSNNAFDQWLELHRQLYPEQRVRAAYLELVSPFLGDVLREEAAAQNDIVVAPLCLLPAAHVKNDIPLAIAALQRDFPQVKVTAAQPLGVHEELIRFWAEHPRLSEVPETGRDEWILLCVGRGSSDVDANSSFYKIARLIAEAMGLKNMIPAFIGITWPNVEEALNIIARQRPKGVLMLPYFLFQGTLVQKLSEKLTAFQSRYPWIEMIALEPFGPHPVLSTVIEERIAEAGGAKGQPLPCVSCSYRVPLGRLQSQVGGLKSLLWSVRHQFTHQQAMPHQHAHTPLQKHVLVCTNHDCAQRGSVQIALTLQKALRKAGRHRDVKVTRTSCLGRCGEGPTLAVYPDGVWYRDMDAAAAEALVEQHLLNDRLLADKVDSLL